MGGNVVKSIDAEINDLCLVVSAYSVAPAPAGIFDGTSAVATTAD
jgi:hypothetical protein